MNGEPAVKASASRGNMFFIIYIGVPFWFSYSIHVGRTNCGHCLPGRRKTRMKDPMKDNTANETQ